MATWLDIVPEASGWTLVDTGRLAELVQSLSHPRTQFPALIYFAGNGNRVKALRALFPRNNVTRRGPAAFARLHLSTETANTQHPILFAESNLFNDLGLGESMLYSKPEKLHRYSILQGKSCSSSSVRQRVMSRAILPWTHVLCLFVDTLSEIRGARQLLDHPLLSMRVGSQFLTKFTKVVIVFNSVPKLDPTMTSRIEYGSQFQGIHIDDLTLVDLSDRCQLSPTAAYEPLRRIILDRLHSAREEQIQEGLSFSAEHLSVLWTKTLQLEMRRPDSASLDILQTARENFQFGTTGMQHLTNFLHCAREHGRATGEVHAFIASALLMDAYPPGMHREWIFNPNLFSARGRLTSTVFHPDVIFKEVYGKACTASWTSYSDTDTRNACDGILEHFNSFYSEMSPVRPSATVRRSFLGSSSRLWKGLYSDTTCFLCLSRPPELVLPCYHAICDTCAVIFGDRSKKAEYHFDISQCPLCLTNFQFTARQLPPTKNPVLLSLDGGGIRGIVQLGLLSVLERRLGEQAPLAFIFDLCVGTSVGALNMMDLIFNRSSAENSFRRFPEIARKVFDRATTSLPNNRLSRWVKCIMGILSDGQYDGRNLESTLKELLGPNRRIFDVGTTHNVASRVAIITSRTSDGKACVLANYHGVSRHAEGSAYEFLEFQDQSQIPFLWEAARCSVAAPWFFQTKSLPGFGPLQDGGVRANNPLSIALKERAIVWPRKDAHGLLISVGTGFTELKGLNFPKATAEHHFQAAGAPEDHGNGSTAFRGTLQELAVPRLIRATLSSPAMDGEQAFLEALNYVPDHMRADIHRLNHPLPEPLPRLDEVEKLAELADSSFNVSDELVRAILITAFFFFELDQIPTTEQGSFYCEGSILCTSPESRKLIKRVLVEFPDARFQIAHGYSLGPIDEDDGCEDCGYYRKKVAFTVKSLEENVTIQVANSTFEQRLGGFPKSVQKLLSDQQAHAHFGRADHLPTTWPLKRQCFCARGAKRHIEFLEPPLQRKKQRL